MKYILITNQTIEWRHPDITICKEHTDQAFIALKVVSEHSIIALDIETTGLNTWRDAVLLVALYHPSFEYCVVIDTISVDITILNRIDWKNKIMIAHSAAFESKFLLYRGIKLYNVWCTLVAEQKILQGAEGFSMSLINTLSRRGIELPEHMDKEIRQDFIKDNFKLEAKHVLYNAGDVLPLHELMEKQKVLVRKFKLDFFIGSIHMPLVLILVRMELEGMIHLSDKWNSYADEIAVYCDGLNTELNDLTMEFINWQQINSDYRKEKEKKDKGTTRTKERLAKLKATLIRLKTANKTGLKSFKIAQEGYIKASDELEIYEALSLEDKIGINWSSSKQVLEAFVELGLFPLPQSKSATTHKMQPSISVAARESWLLNNKDTEFHPLMVTFDEMQGKLHNVKSFGRKWVEKYTNPITGKVHTTYRNDAATGRLTSGNAKEGLYNSQQVPGDIIKGEDNIPYAPYRVCFTVEEGYGVATIDYSGAELCFMAAIGRDKRLVELSKGDMHSHFANKGWEAIYKSRGLRMVGHQVISKNQNKDQRTDYKPMMFGTIYGLRAKKAGEILNVSVHEGQLAINTIVDELPDTVAVVEAAVEFAKSHGYVIHNSRTNSRRWFSPVLLAKREDRELTFMENMNVEGSARNTRIQGSQADLVMEALVVAQRWIDIYKIDAYLLLTVHDEIVFKWNLDLEWFPERAKQLMERVAVNYMDGFLTLHADLDKGLTWIK